MIFMIVLKKSLLTGTYTITATDLLSDDLGLGLVYDASGIYFGFATGLCET